MEKSVSKEQGSQLQANEEIDYLFGPQKQNRLINEIVPYDERKMTDVCCLLIGLLFTILVVGFPFMKKNDMFVHQLRLPSDSDGKVCGIDYPSYPYLYFTNPPDISQRVCVSSCPTTQISELDCKPTKGQSCSISGQVKYFKTTPKESLNGKLCMPQDSSVRKSLQKDNQLLNKYFFFMDYVVYYLRVASVAGMALLVVILSQICPGFTMHLVIFLSLIATLGLGTVFYVFHTETLVEKIIVAGILGVIFLFTVIQVLNFRQSIKFTKIFFSQSKKFVSSNPHTFFYILFFMIILAAFLYLNHILYSNGLGMKAGTFDPNTSLYYLPDKNTFILVVTILAVYLLWGIGCILQTFGFFVSAHVHHHVFKPQNECSAFFLALKLALGKHLGTIFAAAFVNTFLFLPSVIYDNFRSCFGGCFGSVFDLVRADAISFCALSGNAYCNSAKYCEYLWFQSMTTQNIKSSLIVFKVAAEMMATTSAAIGSLFIWGELPSSVLYFNLVVGLIIAALFVELQSEACETIRLIYLIEEQSFKRRQELVKEATNSLNRADQLKFIKFSTQIYSNKEVANQIASMRQSFWGIEIPVEEKMEKKPGKKSARTSR